MKYLLTILSIFSFAYAQVPKSYFGEHILGNTGSNLTWPAWRPSAVRLWNNYAPNSSNVYDGIAWSNVNTADGVYDWERFDKILLKYKSEGVTDLLYTIGATPTWAGGGVNRDGPPSNMAYLTTYITAAANRAISLGIPIKYWEIWNEPSNGPGQYDGFNGSINQMLTIAQTVYNAVKAVSSSYQVVSPSCQGYGTDTTAYNPATTNPGTVSTRWMNTFLEYGGGAYCDIMAFHGYISTVDEDIVTLINTYKKSYTAYGQSAKEMWDTETYDIAAGGANTSENTNFLAVTYLLEWVSGVDRKYWYTYEDASSGQQWTSAGGLNAAGVANQELISWMEGAIVDNLTISNSVYTVRVTRNGQESMIVWNKSGNSAYITSFTRYTDLTGNTGTVSGSATIGKAPILLSTPTVSSCGGCSCKIGG